MKAAVARLAIPGDPATPTGGYIYDSRVIAASRGALAALALPGGFPFPSASALAKTRAALADAPEPVIVDGLAYGALPAALIESLPRRPLALCHHPLGKETGLSGETARRLLECERAALALAAHVIVTSAETKRGLVAEFGVMESRITIAPPGLDPAPPAAEQRGGGESPPLILTVAALTPRKDHLTLVGAFERLAAERPDLGWRAAFVGPKDHAPAATAAIRAAIDAAGIGSRIELVGAAGGPALDAFYDRAAIFALPSRYEGYGMAFAEAMMRGLPVIAADTGAAGADAPDGARRLVPAGNVQGFAEALAALLDDREERIRIGAAARAHALTLPDWSATWAAFRAALPAAS